MHIKYLVISACFSQMLDFDLFLFDFIAVLVN